METNYIWTLWWQGEEKAPEIVKECFASMRKHAGKAKLYILDEGSVEKYIKIPDIILEKYRKGNISLTHLSDIIRFELIYKYGGLWIDSTVLLTEDIPDWIFDMEFYSVRNGAGGDTRNIAKDRWTSFVIGGKPENLVAENVRWLFYEYWKQYDRLVCYFLIDFCLNDVYNTLPEARTLIDAVPVYKGNVFMGQEGIFHKKTWKVPNGNIHFWRMKSLMRHIRDFFNLRNIREWGMEINWYTFWSGCLRQSNSSLAKKVSEKYNNVIEKFWRGCERLQNKEVSY